MSINPVWIQHNIISEVSFKLFSNTFFTFVIGISWGFLTSYSLKSSYESLTTHFDNFDIIMMILAPLVSYLIAESLNISGLLSLITCAFVLGIYAKKNLGKDRESLLSNCFRAMAYSSRTICDLLLGIGFGIHF